MLHLGPWWYLETTSASHTISGVDGLAHCSDELETVRSKMTSESQRKPPSLLEGEHAGEPQDTLFNMCSQCNSKDESSWPDTQGRLYCANCWDNYCWDCWRSQVLEAVFAALDRADQNYAAKNNEWDIMPRRYMVSPAHHSHGAGNVIFLDRFHGLVVEICCVL